MRITSGYQFDVYTRNIRDAQANYFLAQERVLTGKRFNRVSEDPVAALNSLNAKSLRARIEQLDKNLMVAKEYTGTTETVLGEANTALQRAYALAIQGASDATTQESRAAMANEIAAIQQRIVDLGNTRGVNGKYMFAGQASGTKPFDASSGALNFNGDVLPINVEVRPAETMRVNLENADVLFGDVYTALENLRNDLLGGDIGALSDQDIDAIRQSLDSVGVARGGNGTKLNEISRLQDENGRRIDDLTKTVSDNEDVDMAEAITKMQMAETAYTAALQVTSKGFGLSLMDFIR